MAADTGKPDRFTRRRYLRSLAGTVLRNPLLAALAGLAIGGTISLVISAVIGG